MKPIAAALIALSLTGGPALAENRIDTVRPDAPVLAGYGDHAISVRTLTLTDPDRLDILASTEADVRGPGGDRRVDRFGRREPADLDFRPGHSVRASPRSPAPRPRDRRRG